METFRLEKILKVKNEEWILCKRVMKIMQVGVLFNLSTRFDKMSKVPIVVWSRTLTQFRTITEIGRASCRERV